MFIGHVTGEIVSTINHPDYDNRRLLVIDRLDPSGSPAGGYLIAVAAIEAGIGSLKTRSEDHAARHGRPGAWTCDDVAAAPLEANARARPRGPNGPTPDQAWALRSPLDPTERACFQRSVEIYRCDARREHNLTDDQPFDVMTERSIDRVAIRRALVEHGLLEERKDK